MNAGYSIAQLGQHYSPIPSCPDARTPWLVVLLDFFATGTFVGIPGRPFCNLAKIVCLHLSSQSRIVPQQLTSARRGSDHSPVFQSRKSVSPPQSRGRHFRGPGLGCERRLDGNSHWIPRSTHSRRSDLPARRERGCSRLHAVSPLWPAHDGGPGVFARCACPGRPPRPDVSESTQMTHLGIVIGDGFLVLVIFRVDEILSELVFCRADPLELVVSDTKVRLTLPGTKPLGSKRKMFCVPKSSPCSSSVRPPSYPWWIRRSNVPWLSWRERCCLWTVVSEVRLPAQTLALVFELFNGPLRDEPVHVAGVSGKAQRWLTQCAAGQCGTRDPSLGDRLPDLSSAQPIRHDSLQSGSKMTTLLAAVRLRPTPPACVLMSRMK
jgi:hypothetical protein